MAEEKNKSDKAKEKKEESKKEKEMSKEKKDTDKVKEKTKKTAVKSKSIDEILSVIEKMTVLELSELVKALECTVKVGRS